MTIIADAMANPGAKKSKKYGENGSYPFFGQKIKIINKKKRVKNGMAKILSITIQIICRRFAKFFFFTQVSQKGTCLNEYNFPSIVPAKYPKQSDSHAARISAKPAMVSLFLKDSHHNSIEK